MTSIRAGIKQYIELRQAYGLKFSSAIPVLHQFAEFCRKNRHQTITTAAVIDWTQTYPESTRLSISTRIRIVRGFAAYWKVFDPKTEIPPRELSREKSGRIKPHIYTNREIAGILDACLKFNAERGQSNPIRRQTFYTCFGLIAATGLRRNEAIQLKRAHVDLKQGTLLVEMTKFKKSRLIPIHSTTLEQLRDYASFRDRAVPSPRCDNFFVMNRGQPMDGDSVFYAFVHACQTARLRPTAAGAGFPRIHDLRHTFAVRVILQWLEQDKDIHALMPALSTYLGHAQPSDTYWYLTGVPELLRFGLRAGQR
jgi:integrase/recombinase XerD